MITHGLRANTVYVSKGGYIVEIIGRHPVNEYLWQASLRTSPGVNTTNTPAKNINSLRGNGWCYEYNGKICRLNDNWNCTLELVAEVPDYTVLNFNNLPPTIHLVDGYPMVRKEPAMDGHISYDISENPYKDIINRSCEKFFKELDLSKYMKLVKDKPFTAPSPTKEELEAKPPNPVIEFGKRMFTYWLYEPTKTITIQAAKSVRYALVLSILGSAGYGSFHPDQIKSFVTKCLPKVSVEAPEIMR